MAAMSEGRPETGENQHRGLSAKKAESLLSSTTSDASKEAVVSASSSAPPSDLVHHPPNPRLAQMKQVMEEVYGSIHPHQHGHSSSSSSSSSSTASHPQSAAHWKPRPYVEGHKGRYLWTDAYGVCNFITLFCETKEIAYLEQAEALIRDVHDTLGKTRDGKRRLGEATEEHPLLGGLRIGKPDPEGSEDGDGQYFHYLTKWMFALNRMSWIKNEMRYNDWAIELAKSIHPHFVYQRDTDAPRMYWKISIDLSEPLVFSEGNLDPFDGYVTYRLLQERSINPNVLAQEIADMDKMVRNKYRQYHSSDALDLGEALWISHWYPTEQWAVRVAEVSAKGVDRLYDSGRFASSKRYRLAFREFGTTIGVQVNDKADPRWSQRVEEVHAFWSKDLYGRDRDITPVMFCTSLIPGAVTRGYVENKAQEK